MLKLKKWHWILIILIVLILLIIFFYPRPAGKNSVCGCVTELNIGCSCFGIMDTNINGIRKKYYFFDLDDSSLDQSIHSNRLDECINWNLICYGLPYDCYGTIQECKTENWDDN